MSEQIDWSKAPEGATHYNRQCGDWYKVQDGDASVWSDCRRAWVTSELWGNRKGFCIERQPSWSGEDLPPVGVVCEVAPDNSLWGFSTLEVRKCVVIAYHADFVWLDLFVPGIPVATRVDKVTFRHIRTPEQIAADEREAEIEEIVSVMRKTRYRLKQTEISPAEIAEGYAEAIHAAGYRKP